MPSAQCGRPDRAGASDHANRRLRVEARFRSLRAANLLDKKQKYVLCILVAGILLPLRPGRAGQRETVTV